MPNTKQLSIYFPDDLRGRLKEKAAEQGVTPAAVVRDAVSAWLKPKPSEAAVDAVMEIWQADMDKRAAVVVKPNVTPIAPPLSAVTTQRQGERCYHMGDDAVTRWHLTTRPCPAGTTWANRLEAADLGALPPEAIPQD